MARKLKLVTFAVASFGTTRAALSATDLWVRGVLIQADHANSDKVHVGDVTVTAALGHTLNARESLNLEALVWPRDHDEINLKDVYVIGGAAAQVVRVQYLASRD